MTGDAIAIILEPIRDATWRAALRATADTWRSAHENNDPQFGVLRARVSDAECDALDTAIIFNTYSWKEAPMVRGALRSIWQSMT